MYSEFLSAVSLGAPENSAIQKLSSISISIIIIVRLVEADGYMCAHQGQLSGEDSAL